jgi:hypothetical protein
MKMSNTRINTSGILPRNAPLTVDDIRGLMCAQGFVDGTIAVTTSEMIDNDYEGFLDLLENRLVGFQVLSDIQEEMVGADVTAGEVYFKVSGYVDLEGLI